MESQMLVYVISFLVGFDLAGLFYIRRHSIGQYFNRVFSAL